MMTVIHFLNMHLLPFFMLLSLGGAFVTALAGRRLRRMPERVATVVTFILLLLSLYGMHCVSRGGMLVYYSGGWPPPLGITLVLDGLSAFMLVTVNVIAFVVSIYSIDYMKRYTSPWKFYTLFLLMTAGMNGVVVTGDLFNLYVFLEVAAVASYALVAFGTERDELEAGFKYMVMGSLASCLILFGIAILYGMTSTLNMADMAKVLSAGGHEGLLLIVLALFLAGFGLKAALVPFHAWLPDAHPSAPASISAMLSGVLIKTLGIYALFRVLFCIIGVTGMALGVLRLLGALSMLAGVVLAVAQWDLKRLLAYHSISQVGYVVLGLALGTPLGIYGGLFHLFNHSVFKSLLFLNAGAVDYATGTRDLKEMGGLRQRMPVTGWTSFAASMSISGIFPFNGFFSKLLIIAACVQAGRYFYGFWAVVASVLTLASFMKVQKYAFSGALRERWRSVREVPNGMKGAMIMCALLCLFGGALLLPRISSLFLGPARDALIAGTGYAAGVVGMIE